MGLSDVRFMTGYHGGCPLVYLERRLNYIRLASLVFTHSCKRCFYCFRSSSTKIIKLWVSQRQHYFIVKSHKTSVHYYHLFSQRHFIWRRWSHKLQMGLIQMRTESSGALFMSKREQMANRLHQALFLQMHPIKILRSPFCILVLRQKTLTPELPKSPEPPGQGL